MHSCCSSAAVGDESVTANHGGWALSFFSQPAVPPHCATVPSCLVTMLNSPTHGVELRGESRRLLARCATSVHGYADDRRAKPQRSEASAIRHPLQRRGCALPLAPHTQHSMQQSPHMYTTAMAGDARHLCDDPTSLRAGDESRSISPVRACAVSRVRRPPRGDCGMMDDRERTLRTHG